MRIIFLFFSFLLPTLSFSQGQVRTVNVVNDQIVAVHTRVGMATLIQLPDRPSSVVIGDQSSFKLEYLDKALTVKPLYPGAKTNLYVYTDFYRFNIELTSASSSKSCDYVVYLKRNAAPSQSGPLVKWKSFQKSVKAKSVTAQINRVGSAPDGTVWLEFKITSNDPKEFPPEWVWLTENGKVRPIHALYLSGTKSSRLSPITGVITLRKADFSGSHDVHIEIRDAEKIAIQIPKAVLWK